MQAHQKPRPQRPILDPLAGYLSMGVLVAIVVFDALPLLMLLVSAVIAGVTTGEFPAGGGMGDSGTFPGIDPQLWMAWIPVGLYALWSLVSFPLPLVRHRSKRGSMLMTGFLLFAATVARVAGFVGSDRFPDGGTRWIYVAILCVAGLILLRMVLGWLRMVPQSWRNGSG